MTSTNQFAKAASAVPVVYRILAYALAILLVLCANIAVGERALLLFA